MLTNALSHAKVIKEYGAKNAGTKVLQGYLEQFIYMIM